MKKFMRQSGRSLIEVMISITIGLAVLGAIIAVYTATTSTSKQSDAGQRMSEDAAIALNYIGNFVRMAGFSFPQANLPVNTALSGSVAVALQDRNFTGAGVRGCDNGFTVPSVSPTTSLTCATAGGNAAIALRFEADTSNTFPTSGAPPLPTDCLNQSVSNNAVSDYDGTTPYTLAEARFFLATGAASGSRDLYCSGNGNAAFASQPIVQYVDGLTISYGIARDTVSRDVVQYATSAQVDALGGTMDQNWSRVVSLRVCVLMRSELPDQAGTGSYVNCAGNVVTAPDRFMRRAFSSVMTLRNRGGFSV